MTNRHLRVVATGAAAALLIAVAACSSAKPTPTLAPMTASPSPAATETATDTPTSTDTPFVVPTDTPMSSPTVVASVTPTPTPSPTPSGPAGGCSGSDENKVWWTGESPHFTFTVYCGVMPSGWYFSAANDNWKNGGKLDATYKGPNGGLFTINEGAFCTTDCSTGTSIGSANFGDLTGGLYSLSAGYAIYVDPGTAHAYTAVGTNMSQATFTKLAASLIQVPKS